MARKKKTPVQDGMVNVMTGLGDLNFDKRLHAYDSVDVLTFQKLTDIYRSNAFAARAVDLPVNEMFRAGFEVKVEGDEELSGQLAAISDDLEVRETFQEAERLRRLYGGSVILLGVNDGQEKLSTPLDPKRVQSLDYITVFDASEARIKEWEVNPLAKNFGKPASFAIVPTSMGKGASNLLGDVHASRCIYFNGIKASRDALKQGTLGVQVGWGDSVLTRLHWICRDLGATWESVAALLQDFSVAVMQVEGLNQALLADLDGTIIKRLKTHQLMRSVFHGVVTDVNESFERKTTSLAGLPEILDRFADLLSGAAGIPKTVLFGQAPGGLNATGDNDVRGFYDMVAARQKNELRPQLEKLYRVLFASKQGPTRGKEPEQWGIDFHPLWQMSESEKATIRLNMANADNIYIQAGVLDPHEVAEARFGGEQYSVDTTIERDTETDSEGEEIETEPEAEQTKTDPNTLALVTSATKGEIPADVNVLIALGMPADLAKTLVAALESKDANGSSTVQGPGSSPPEKQE